MSDESPFLPKFPRSISGRSHRLPLDRDELEVIGRRMDGIYSTAHLSDNHRAMALKLYAELVVLDKSRQNYSKKILIITDHYQVVDFDAPLPFSHNYFVRLFNEQNEWLVRLVSWLDRVGTPVRHVNVASDDDEVRKVSPGDDI